MKNLRICSFLFAVLIFSACASGRIKVDHKLKSYRPISKELYDTIFQMDSILFQAFNTCDVEKFTSLLSDDVEFYHDQSGLMISSKTQSDGLKIRCAEQGRNGVLRRELVKESLEVYPLKNYGAVQIGVHNFYRTLPGKKEKLTTVAKFMNIWEFRNGRWIVSRIVSYDHEEIE